MVVADCPVCGQENDHAYGCVVGELQALGKDGRQAHRRALLLVLLHTHGPVQPRTLAELSELALYSVHEITNGLMREGLIYPDFPTNCFNLTHAPHVRVACDQAADLLGLVLTSPRSPLSPLIEVMS